MDVMFDKLLGRIREGGNGKGEQPKKITVEDAELIPAEVLETLATGDIVASETNNIGFIVSHVDNSDGDLDVTLLGYLESDLIQVLRYNIHEGNLSLFVEGIPVYIPVINGSAQQLTHILPNRVYKFGTLTGEIVFGIVTSGEIAGRLYTYRWTFNTGSPEPKITWPAEITMWQGGSAPEIKPNKHYEITVFDGFAVCFTNDDVLAGKQDLLVSGTNIKTVNGQSILGSGNLEVDGHFRGTYLSNDTKPTNGQAGDYIHVIVSDGGTPPTYTIQVWTWTGSAFAGSGATASQNDTQFKTEEWVGETGIAQDLGESIDDVISQKAVTDKVRVYENITSQFDFTDGEFVVAGENSFEYPIGSIHSAASQGMNASDYVDIGGADKLAITLYNSTNQNLYSGLCFYDENHDILSEYSIVHAGAAITDNVLEIIDIPSIAKYIRTTCRIGDGYTPFSCTKITNVNKITASLKQLLGNSENITSQFIFTQGYVIISAANPNNRSIGNSVMSNSLEMNASDYVDIGDANKLVITLYNSPTTHAGLCFYDEGYNVMGNYAVTSNIQDVTDNVFLIVDIPYGAKYIRTTCRIGDGYTPFSCTKTFDNITTKVTKIKDDVEFLTPLVSAFQYQKGNIVETKDVGVRLTSLTLIKDKIYCFEYSSNDDHTVPSNVNVFALDKGLIGNWVKRLSSNIGHQNTVDYSEANGCMITSNGGNSTNVQPNTIYIFKDAADLNEFDVTDSNNCVSIDIHTQQWGKQPNVCWANAVNGDCDTAFVLTNYEEGNMYYHDQGNTPLSGVTESKRYIRLVKFGRTEGEFDGTFTVLKTWERPFVYEEANNDTQFFDGIIYENIVRFTPDLTWEEHSFDNYGNDIITEKKVVFMNRSTPAELEGIAVSNDYIYVGVRNSVSVIKK